MPLPKVILAAAGSGKTFDLVESALRGQPRQVLIVTYTDQNLAEIRKELIARCGVVPKSIHLQSWYAFLLRHCVRPYQHPLFPKARIERPYFSGSAEEDKAIRNRRYVKKENVEDYYIVGGNLIVGEFASDFAVTCNALNDGAVFKRLSRIYDAVFIDEVQDLAGYDLEILKLLFESGLEIQVVGDCRQVTYKTNSVSQKNKQFRDEKIIEFFESLEKRSLCEIITKTASRRCNQPICDFADRVYPEFPSTTSENQQQTGHDGIFFVSSTDVDKYILKYSPQVLRWSRQTVTPSVNALNFGESKGLSFSRVLLYPTSAIKAFIKTADVSGMASSSRAKFYVAVTRARQSVAFVWDGPSHDDFRDFNYKI